MSKGILRKMKHEWKKDEPVSYSLHFQNQELIPLNKHVGQKIKLKATGHIECIECARPIKKTFNQGFCYPCMQSLASCDICIVKPELCHYANGTCRQPSWGEEHCFIDHTIYLSNTSGLKVGITRSFQQMTRWVDQGAIQAIPLGTVKDRKTSGVLEKKLSQNIADKTNWRNMLKGIAEPVDLKAERERVLEGGIDFSELKVSDEDAVAIQYPVERFPEKVKSHNFDKTPLVEGTLEGIKGQYLLLDTGVINLRKFQGYEVAFG